MRFVPRSFDPDETPKRDIYCLPGLHTWLYQADKSKSLEYKERIQAHLVRFVKGKNVDNADYMKNWKSDVWELRIRLLSRKEVTRIFCTVPKPDSLFCVHWKLRRYFGGNDDPRWDRAINRVIKEWDKYFPGHKPVKSRPFSNCVTFNSFDHFDSNGR